MRRVYLAWSLLHGAAALVVASMMAGSLLALIANSLRNLVDAVLLAAEYVFLAGAPLLMLCCWRRWTRALHAAVAGVVAVAGIILVDWMPTAINCSDVQLLSLAAAIGVAAALAAWTYLRLAGILPRPGSRMGGPEETAVPPWRHSLLMLGIVLLIAALLVALWPLAQLVRNEPIGPWLQGFAYQGIVSPR